MTEGEREAMRMLDAAKCNANKDNEDRRRGLGVLEYTSLILDVLLKVGLREGNMWSRLRSKEGIMLGQELSSRGKASRVPKV